jgi:transcriptional regulator with XRE-family HTH domain
MATMAPRAASPTHGVSTCGTVPPFLIVGSRFGDRAAVGRMWRLGGSSGDRPKVPLQPPGQMDDDLGLQQQDDDGEEDDGEAPKQEQRLTQRRLARTLRRLREGAGLTIDQVADRLELSPSTISRIENAQVGVRRVDVREMLEIYDVTGAQRAELLELASASRRQRWWHKYRDLPDVTLAGFEDDAASISQYSALVLPGLLQTREYLTEVLHATLYDAPVDEIERRLQLRVQRQELLTREKAPDLWVVIDEAALHRRVGGDQVMRAQIAHLVDAAALPNVTIQVLQFAAGAHTGMDGEFAILSYRDAADPDLVYVENSGGDLYLDNDDITAGYRRIFSHLQAAALKPAESVRALIDIQ